MSNPDDSPNRCMICDTPCTGEYCLNCQEVHKAPEAARKKLLLLVCLPTDYQATPEPGSRIVTCQNCGKRVWATDETVMIKKQDPEHNKIICVPCSKKIKERK